MLYQVSKCLIGFMHLYFTDPEDDQEADQGRGLDHGGDQGHAEGLGHEGGQGQELENHVLDTGQDPDIVDHGQGVTLQKRYARKRSVIVNGITVWSVS